MRSAVRRTLGQKAGEFPVSRRRGTPLPRARQSSLVRLQRGLGNQAFGVAQGLGPIQAKLKVGAPNDRFEQEADRVADQVMRMSDPVDRGPIDKPGQAAKGIQRKCSACEEEARRQPIEGAMEELQMKRAPGPAPAIGPGLQARIGGLRGGGRPLSPTLRGFFEPRFGHDFSRVRVHTDGPAADAARSINARAFTFGNQIAFANGEYRPGTQQGRQLLAHELTHTVQQESRDSVVQRSLLTCEQGEDCPDREAGERSWARSSGIRAEFVTSPENGFLVSGFPINSSETSGIESQPSWPRFWGGLVTGDDIWQVRGFSDCLGDDALNASLRLGRAVAARAALPPLAQAKVLAFFGAPIDQCVAGNANKEERSVNRAAFFQNLSENTDSEEEPVTGGDTPAPAPTVPAPPEECAPTGARETAAGCTPNPHGAHLPPVGRTHTEAHPLEPCLFPESVVAASPDWCVDAQQGHGGETCYREIPSTTGGPGAQYCYSVNCCHNSGDLVSVVDPASPGSGSCCQDAGLGTRLEHGVRDVGPEILEDPVRVFEDLTGLDVPFFGE